MLSRGGVGREQGLRARGCQIPWVVFLDKVWSLITCLRREGVFAGGFVWPGLTQCVFLASCSPFAAVCTSVMHACLCSPSDLAASNVRGLGLSVCAPQSSAAP